MLVAEPTSFVIWGGNTPGLRLGDRIQFWGAQWSRQVQSGDYAAQADFKGWSTAPLPPRLCQPNAHTTGTPRLDASCWTSKPGNSNPPAKLGNYIQVIVATSIAKNGSTIYGNIAATVVLQVDTSSAYGPDPGHPGYGMVIAVLEDGAGVFGSAAVALMSAQAATATRRISLYSPEMSLMAETELTTTARPAILYEYIWFDGRPLAQVDGAGTVSWTFTDHLGTPLLQTSALQGIVWRAEHEPYGSIYALRSYDRHQPLRFPGQEAEQIGTGANGVTERSYNIYRWYEPQAGRYTQPDPMGLRGGTNLFQYVLGRPTILTDRLGLRVQVCCRRLVSPFSGFRHCFIRIVSDRTGEVRTEGLHTEQTISNFLWAATPFGTTGRPETDHPFDLAPPTPDDDCGAWVKDCGATDACAITAAASYPRKSYYTVFGPNSNTFASYIATKCNLAIPISANGWDSPGWWTRDD